MELTLINSREKIWYYRSGERRKLFPQIPHSSPLQLTISTFYATCPNLANTLVIHMCGNIKKQAYACFLCLIKDVISFGMSLHPPTPHRHAHLALHFHRPWRFSPQDQLDNSLG